MGYLEKESSLQVVIEEISNRWDQSVGCRRLFHGRGGCFDGYEGLSIDYFNRHVLITSYKDYGSLFYAQLSNLIKEFFATQQSSFLDSIQIQKRYKDNIWQNQFGEQLADLIISEGNLRYKIDLSARQNIGFFLDMKNGRDYVRQHSQGLRVLNLFSYTCSLSVAALEGRAQSVCNVDMSKSALGRGRENHRLNGHKTSAIRFLPYNILKSLKNIANKGPFDLVIVDPPTQQGINFEVVRDYKKVVRRIPEMLATEAKVMACLNSPQLGDGFLTDLFAQPGFRYGGKIDNPLEFKEKIQSRGLKVHIFNWQRPSS